MMIRKLEEKDIAICLNIYNYYIENTCFTLEEEKLSLDDFKTRCENILNKYPFIVLENDEGIVIGYAYLNTFNPRSAYRKTADLSIYVSKDHLHEHAGKILLQEIEKLAVTYGITNIISIVTSENKNSVHFHQKNGFVLEGTMHDVALKFGKIISVDYYRKPLSK